MKENSGKRVSYLDMEVWRELQEAKTVTSYCCHWLALQCMMVRDVSSAVVLAQEGQEEVLAPVSIWPAGSTAVSEQLKEVAEQAHESHQGVVQQLDDASYIGYPVWSGNTLKAIVVLEVLPRPMDELRTVLRVLQWGASWLDNFFLRQNPPETSTGKELSGEQQERLERQVDLLAHTMEQKDYTHACMLLVNELGNLFGCDRVSIGVKKGRRVVVKAISHSAQMDKKMNLVHEISNAMDEVMDQDAKIHYPNDKNYLLITHAHAKLVSSNEGGAVLSLPLKGATGAAFGVLTLEQGETEIAFDDNCITFCETLAVLLGPLLQSMQKNDAPLWEKAGDSWRRQWGRLLGEEYLLRKFVVAGALAVTLFLAFYHDSYRVSAKASIEGELRRVIVVPFDSFINEAFARVGDEVKKGELLMTLDDKDLRLERLKWVAKRSEYSHHYQQAQADRDLTESRLAQVQIEQSEAELALVNERIHHTRITAPFDGLIVDGDLSQSLGSVVQKGDQLFEMAPLTAYRVVLKVDEAVISDIATGQEGELYLTSIPGDTFPFQVARITPISVAEDGINYFKVEGNLTAFPRTLRPGMEGIGKVTIGERNIFWIWTHEMFNWLRLKIWVYTGLKLGVSNAPLASSQELSEPVTFTSTES